MHEARAVTDFAVGGNYALTEAVRVHAGYATDRSPVVADTRSAFRKVDLWHVTGGVSVTARRLSGSFGIGYAAGHGGGAVVGGSDVATTETAKLHVGTLSILYALTFGF
jgi:long-subunit fatty acid transport protein